MGSWSGLWLQRTIAADGSSPWYDMQDYIGRPRGSSDVDIGFHHATIRTKPSGAAGAETLDIVMNVAWDSSGASSLKLHDFTQIINTNAPETLILPGGESEGVLVAFYDGVDEAAFKGAAIIPPYWQLEYDIGTTPVNVDFYVSLAW